jgi:modulator of FtsH protease
MDPYGRTIYVEEVKEAKIISFVKETYKLFGASLFTGALGAYLTMPYVQTISEHKFIFFIIEIALMFGIFFTKKMPGINLVNLFAFTFMTGVTSVPLITSVLSLSSGASIIGNAFLMTSLIMGIMSTIAIKSKKDFTRYSKVMFISLIVIIVFSLINLFILQNPIFATIISGIVVLLFSFMTIIDTQNIMRGNYETPIEGAIALYLDFLNIFLSLIQILGITNSED